MLTCVKVNGVTRHLQDNKDIVSYNQAQQTYNSANKAFAEADYNKAIELYNKVDDYLKHHPEHKPSFDHSYRNFSMVDMANRHKSLGKITPKLIHRVLVIFIENVSAPYDGNIVKTIMPFDVRKQAEISWGVCSRLIEVLTDGELTLQFDSINLSSTLTSLEEPADGDRLAPADRMIYSLSPYPAELISDKINDYDSFLFVWNHKENDGTTYYKGAHGWGGVSRIMFSPYLLEGPPRGRQVISTGLIHRPGTILHELFHTFESCYDITPLHGFQDKNKKYFPEWKGNGELDYYEYHFQKIAQLDGLSKFCFSKIYPQQGSDKELKEKIKLIKNIALADRQKARRITNKAVNDEKLFKKALQLNPYDSEILLSYTVFLHSANRKTEALDKIELAYLHAPYNPEICYWMGVETYHSGNIKAAINHMKEALKINSKLKKATEYLKFLMKK